MVMPKHELAVCLTTWNRCKVSWKEGYLEIVPNMVKSLARCKLAENTQLVIAEWESEDWIGDEVLDRMYPGPTKVVRLGGDREFNSGRGRNYAGRAADAVRIMFVEADMIFPEGLLVQAMEGMIEGIQAFAPRCWRFEDPDKPETGWWSKGFGNMGVFATDFKKTGGFPPLRGWGGDDNGFARRLRKRLKMKFNRSCVEGFIHQWHPCDNEWYALSKRGRK